MSYLIKYSTVALLKLEVMTQQGIKAQTTLYLEVLKYVEVLLREEFRDDSRYDQKMLLQSILWNEAANFVIAYSEAEPCTATDFLGCLFTQLVKKGPVSLEEYLPENGFDFSLNHIDGRTYHLRISPVNFYLKDFFSETISERDKRVAEFLIRNVPKLVRAGNNLIDSKALDQISDLLIRVATDNYFLTDIDLFNVTLFLRNQYINSRYPFNEQSIPVVPVSINSSGRNIYFNPGK